jgi:hypothetical protein
VAGSVQSDSITGSTITMKNTGSTIVASDGTTAVLSESGGTVTLTADEANVGSNALVVDSSGNVGIGTSPSTKLDISDTSRLTVNVSNAYVLETSINSTGSAFASHYENASDHIFQTSGTERMRIDPSGRVYINTTGQLVNEDKLCVTSGGNVVAFKSTGGEGTNALICWNSGSGTSRGLIGFGAGSTFTSVGSITTNGSNTAYNTLSDYRLKENITEITDGINRVKQLNPSRFNFISDPDKIVDGFIAHEVSDIVPEAITGEKDAVNEDGSIIPQGIDQSKLVPLLTAALQESIALIESQQSQIDTLTTKTQEQDFTIASLISRIEALENP